MQCESLASTFTLQSVGCCRSGYSFNWHIAFTSACNRTKTPKRKGGGGEVGGKKVNMFKWTPGTNKFLYFILLCDFLTDNLGNLRTDAKIILQLVFEKQGLLLLTNSNYKRAGIQSQDFVNNVTNRCVPSKQYFFGRQTSFPVQSILSSNWVNGRSIRQLCMLRIMLCISLLSRI